MVFDQYTNPSEELSETEDKLVDIILETRTRRVSVSGDFARANAEMIAMAASMGLITTRIHMDIYGRDWVPAIAGLEFLDDVELETEEV